MGKQALADVDGNGAVTAQDALAIIYQLNVEQSFRERAETGDTLDATEISTSDIAQHKLDVNGDGNVTAADALNVINVLNLQQVARAVTTGEAEASMFKVNTTVDTGPGSLRQAILDANASTTDAVIRFAVPASDGGFIDFDAALADGDAAADVFRIRPVTPLPAINNTAGKKITIDATTQLTLSGDTNPRGPEVQIDDVGSLSTGLELRTISEVRGLAISNFDYGVYVKGNDIVVAGNYIGTDATGTVASGGSNTGILIEESNRIVIGGVLATDRNVIAANAQEGVFSRFVVNDLRVQNNYIGTNATGTAALGIQGIGVRAESTTNLDILDNVISGNAGIGIATSSTVVDATINRNNIGTNTTGTAAIPNGAHGIELSSGRDFVIGGAQPTDGNLVSGNGQVGIRLVNGNFQNVTLQRNNVGTNLLGTAAIANGVSGISATLEGSTGIRLLDNLVSGNAGAGVYLAFAGVDPTLIQGNKIGTDITGELAVGNAGEGIRLDGGSNVLVGGPGAARNLISGNGGNGISANARDLVITNNYVGTNLTGSRAIGNQSTGIFVGPGSGNVTIGGDTRAEGNLVSGNRDRSGIFTWAAHNLSVQNNLVGADATGFLPLGNVGTGIEVQDSNTFVQDNVVANNTGNGIEIRDNQYPLTQWSVTAGGNGHYYALVPSLTWLEAESLAVASGGHLADVLTPAENDFLKATFGPNRWIGLSDQVNEGQFVWSSGAVYDPLVYRGFGSGEPNGGTHENFVALEENGWNDTGDGGRGRGLGIAEFTTLAAANAFVTANRTVHVRGNLVGLAGNDATALGNGRSGVRVQNARLVKIEDNSIANNSRNGVEITDGSSQVTISNNLIFSNSSLGIDLGDNGVTANDPGDADTGPNGLQNFPVLTFSGGVFAGTLNSQPNKVFEVEVFSDTAANLASAEGRTLIHSTSITTDASGNAMFTIPPASIPSTGQITATATASDGSTSEFSAALTIGPSAEVSVDNLVFTGGANLSLGAAAPGAMIERVVMVTNHGTSNLVLQPATTTGSFDITSNFIAGQILPPGTSASLTVRNTMTLAGVHLGSLRVISSDPINPELNFPLGLSLLTGLNLVKDINPGPASSTARQLTVVGDKLVLRATQSVTGSELWTSDLTGRGDFARERHSPR